ncbi:MAG: hypothetical protein Q7S68_03560, partial [Deltaproteobacteria bacterium]|nr:hypothetical protein [Deltaproteobacteria bacterium]
AHEMVHLIASNLYLCATYRKEKLFFLGKIIETSFDHDTANMSIVDEVIDPALKLHPRYSYITGAMNYKSNDFENILDELNAYTTQSIFQEKYIRSGYIAGASSPNTTLSIDSGSGGVVNFMVYLEAYLQAARLNYPETYQLIQNDPVVISFMQQLWNAAENTLETSFYLTQFDNGTAYHFAVDPAYLKAAYSSALLEELDRLGITHRQSAY